MHTVFWLHTFHTSLRTRQSLRNLNRLQLQCSCLLRAPCWPLQARVSKPFGWAYLTQHSPTSARSMSRLRYAKQQAHHSSDGLRRSYTQLIRENCCLNQQIQADEAEKIPSDVIQRRRGSQDPACQMAEGCVLLSQVPNGAHVSWAGPRGICWDNGKLHIPAKTQESRKEGLTRKWRTARRIRFPCQARFAR